MSENPAYKLVENRYIKEFDTEARLYQHQKTGARVLSLVNSDDNKVFGITFKTPPDDSTGVAHILEHSVLCGSRKYPVKEPFKELMKSSLNTFMNAMTYSDKTVYPVASRNLKDFYNLMDVYLDAVFFPRLGPHVFEQEGWHYERKDGALAYKGVVYNEMKGVYSSPDSLLYEYAQQSLYPDITYGHDSGGDPAHIPDLSYEAFADFHKRLYHPANSLIYFYGDDDPEERLERLDAYLAEFDPAEGLLPIPVQPRFSEPRSIDRVYASSGEESSEQCFVTTNWMLGKSTDLKLNLSMNLLAYMLTGSPASPLRVALIDSGLGEDLTGAGLEGQIHEMYFSSGLKGVAEKDTQAVHELIETTLRDICRDGFAPQMSEAAFNTIEFNLRENNSGSYPRGLVLMLRTLVTWLHDEDPIKPLEFEMLIHEVRQAQEDNPRYFESLIQTWLLDNPHQTQLVLRPDPAYADQEAQAEADRLATAQAAMSEEALDEIAAHAQDLEKMQLTPDSPEALAAMPNLRLKDVKRLVDRIPRQIGRLADTDLILHEQPTNGILYLDLGFNLFTLPNRLIPLIPLFGRTITEMGTTEQSYIELNQRIASKTGGIEETYFSSGIFDATDTTAWMFMRAKVMASGLDDLLAILEDLLLKSDLDDRDRFLHIVLEEKAGEEGNLIPGGHSVVSSRLGARFSLAGSINEQMDGVAYLFFLRELIERIETDWDSVKADLVYIRDTLLNRKFMICNATATGPILEVTQPKLEAFLSQLPVDPEARLKTWDVLELPAYEGLEVPAKVHYVARSIELYKLGYSYSGSALVINRHLRNNLLWDRVRVVGGAYGCFSSIDQKTGVMSFVSYRDPNVESTLDVYAQAGAYLQEDAIDEDELERGIIGTMGDLDACQLPDAKGYGSLLRYLNGLSDERRQAIRDQVLATTSEDFTAFGSMLASAGKPEHIAILGPGEGLARAEQHLGSPLSKRKLLG